MAPQRFDQRQTMFAVHPPAPGAFDGVPGESQGHSMVAYAKTRAASRTFDELQNACACGPKVPEKEPCSLGPAELTQAVLTSAAEFGADAVGICAVREAWIYSCDHSGAPIALPKRCDRAVVLAVAADVDRLQDAQPLAANAETQLSYARSVFATSLMAHFLQVLGWEAQASTNDTALSIPLAVEAGLGLLGRSGLLLTDTHGSAVRLSKVFTDAPLEAAARSGAELQPYCRRCRVCAKACPAQAISMDSEPSYTVTGPWNSQGVLRWPVHAQRCYDHWRRIGSSCSVCQAVCPFSRQKKQLPL